MLKMKPKIIRACTVSMSVSFVDGLREMTEGAGLLFPHGEYKTLAGMIRQLRDDRQLYHQVADACYEKASVFDISKTAAAYDEVYTTILSLPHIHQKIGNPKYVVY